MHPVKRVELIDTGNDQILLATDTKIGYIIANLRHCYLMQYTGLKDKNGVEIYEGDIFKITKEPEEINSVIFYSGCWQFEEHGLYLIDWCDRGIVIGNIYENPELLKEGK